MSSLINIFQGFVDVLQFRCEVRKIATDIGCYFLTTMYTFVLFDVVSNLFGYRVVVAKNITEYFFHDADY